MKGWSNDILSGVIREESLSRKVAFEQWDLNEMRKRGYVTREKFPRSLGSSIIGIFMEQQY